MRVALLTAFLLTVISGKAAGELVAVADTVRFGVIMEAEGPKTVKTYLKNIGDSPAAIMRVRPTCGCTGADYQKSEIMPGDSAWIELTYNPRHRPGKIDKAVKIFPAEGEMIRLPISGKVIASEETLDRLFPVRAGSLRLTETTLLPPAPMEDIVKTLFIDVYNPSDCPIAPKIVSNHQAVEAESMPEAIPPGERGTIVIYLYPRKEDRKGPIEYTLTLQSENEQPTEITIKTSKK